MGTDAYTWIYGLSELLVLTWIGVAFLGYHWWRQRKANMQLRGERLALDAARTEALALLDGAIAATRSDSTQQPTWRNIRVDCLEALRPPLGNEGFGGAQPWKQAIGMLGVALGKLNRDQSGPAGSEDPASVPHHGGAGQPHIDPGPSGPVLNAEIDHLLAQNERSLGRLYTNHSLSVELKRKCQDIQAAHQNLRASLENITRQDASAQLQRIIDELGENYEALLKIALTAERQHGHMAPQLEALQQQVHNLQISVNKYRQSLQQALLARDDLAQEKDQLILEMSAKTKLIERLNQRYNVLRREYGKLYKANRPPKA